MNKPINSALLRHAGMMFVAPAVLATSRGPIAVFFQAAQYGGRITDACTGERTLEGRGIE